jgi:hypothetical protein
MLARRDDYCHATVTGVLYNLVGIVAFVCNNTNSEQNLFFWMDSRRAAHFFLFPLYLSLSPRFQSVMGGRKRKRKDKE